MPTPTYLYMVYVKRPDGSKVRLSAPVRYKDAMELKQILASQSPTKSTGTFHLKRIPYAKRKVYGWQK